MFPHLEPRPDVDPKPDVLGKPGGPMDGGTGPTDSKRIAAGFTYLGQFLDHDVTFDPTSSLERDNDPEALRNFRTPAFELDSLYGSGPDASPYLYARSPRGSLLLGPGGFDVPRNSEDTAIIGDPRNDENLLISQLHLAFLRFHNKVLMRTGDFHSAQRLVRWHYQWIIVHEFLPLIAGPDLVEDVVANGRRFFHWEGPDPFIPVEFSVAAYRFGHSLVRNAYRVNDEFAAPLFDPGGGLDLRGGIPVRLSAEVNRIVDWSLFFKIERNRDPQPAFRIDTRLAGPLLHLPGSAESGLPPSLAVRNLERSQRMRLPSGQTVAARMGVPPLDDTALWNGVPDVEKNAPAPLWYYILREAEVLADGQTLGPVGGRLVVEVFMGLLAGDPDSYMAKNPAWTPNFGDDGEFHMADLLRMAGVA